MDDTTGRVKADRDTVLDPSLPDEAEERAIEIRAEIAETRDEISETIEAIQERLTPAHLAQQATDTVRNATTEKVKQMANTARNSADQILPLAMIGIGTAWLLSKRRSRADVYEGNWRYSTEAGYGRDTRAYGEYEPVGTRGTVENLSVQARETTEQLRDAARRTTRQAQLKFDDVINNNPLMLGAAAALVGAVIGMSVPATETENEWLGEARDTVVDRAKDMVSNVTGQTNS